jgi:hypothetical protein
MFNNLKEDVRESIIVEPKFQLRNKNIVLDYCSKSDYEKISKLFEIIELNDTEFEKVENRIKDKNVDIDLEDIKKHISNEIKSISNSSNAKKLITVKEFEEIYSIPPKTQLQLRNRFRDSLPFIQTANNGNILYNVDKVDKWFDNYVKSRG